MRDPLGVIPCLALRTASNLLVKRIYIRRYRVSPRDTFLAFAVNIETEILGPCTRDQTSRCDRMINGISRDRERERETRASPFRVPHRDPDEANRRGGESKTRRDRER